jgi:hypothetical protein
MRKVDVKDVFFIQVVSVFVKDIGIVLHGYIVVGGVPLVVRLTVALGCGPSIPVPFEFLDSTK